MKFKFAYIDKLKPEIEETVELFLGTRVHEVLEKLYTDLKFQKVPELKELLNFFNDSWKKNWISNRTYFSHRPGNYWNCSPK